MPTAADLDFASCAYCARHLTEKAEGSRVFGNTTERSIRFAKPMQGHQCILMIEVNTPVAAFAVALRESKAAQVDADHCARRRVMLDATTLVADRKLTEAVSTRHRPRKQAMASEDFLTANANRDFIAAQLTELVRDLIRVVAAVSEGSGGAYRAGERMELVTALLARCEDHVSWFPLFSTAVSNLRDWETHHPVDEAILQAAQTGMSLCAESSCTDNAARGRMSKRKSSFLTAMVATEHAREYARQERSD